MDTQPADEPGRQAATPGDDAMGAMLSELARVVEEQVATRGWDQPATLWELHSVDPDELISALGPGTPRPVERSGDAPPRGRTRQAATDTGRADPGEADGERDRSDDHSWAEGLSELRLATAVIFKGQLDGHPLHALVGRHCDDGAYGAALATEGWEFPDDVIADIRAGADAPCAASEHPRRRSVRLVQVLLRDGSGVLLRRHEDDDSVETYSYDNTTNRLEGRVPDALRIYLRSPALSRPRLAARRAAANSWLAAAVALAAGAHRDDLLAGLALPDALARHARAQPGDAALMVAAAMAPSLLRATELGGLAALVDGGDRRGPLVTGTDTEAGSDADRADWELARIHQLEILDALDAKLTGTADGPAPADAGARRRLQERVAEARRFTAWADGTLWAIEAEVIDPDGPVTTLAELVARGQVTDDAARHVLSLAAIDATGYEEALAAARNRAGTPGRNDPCPCGSGKRYKTCHGR